MKSFNLNPYHPDNQPAKAAPVVPPLRPVSLTLSQLDNLANGAARHGRLGHRAGEVMSVEGKTRVAMTEFERWVVDLGWREGQASRDEAGGNGQGK